MANRIDWKPESADPDKHGPRVGCTAAACGLADADVCPFVIKRLEDSNESYPHRHEYRQLLLRTAGNPRAYCIYCLLVQRIDNPEFIM